MPAFITLKPKLALFDIHSTIFVFGSNEAGKHGKGAAFYAKEWRGAVYGQGEGLAGKSYAIPTKDKDLKPLSLEKIEIYIQRFLDFAKANPTLEFQLSRIGCGLAGYTDAMIAPFFIDAPKNVHLPGLWRQILKPNGFHAIIVAGSRDLIDKKKMVNVNSDLIKIKRQKAEEMAYKIIDEHIKKLQDQGKNIVIVSGGATGVDSIGELYADEHQLRCARFPAEWDWQGLSAGMLRNQTMSWWAVEALCIFGEALSRGTAGMLQIAKDDGLVNTRIKLDIK